MVENDLAPVFELLPDAVPTIYHVDIKRQVGHAGGGWGVGLGVLPVSSHHCNICIIKTTFLTPFL